VPEADVNSWVFLFSASNALRWCCSFGKSFLILWCQVGYAAWRTYNTESVSIFSLSECRKFNAERLLTFFASYPAGYGRGTASYFICKVSYNLLN